MGKNPFIASKLTDLEVSALPDPGHGTDEHDGEDDHEGDARGVGESPDGAEDAGPIRHQPVPKVVVGDVIGVRPGRRVGGRRREHGQRNSILAQDPGGIRHHVDACGRLRCRETVR